MFVYIVRHAWAHQHGDPRWPDDADRPLEADGAARFEKVVKRLEKIGWLPEIVATSPYERCRQTADIIAERLEHAPEVVELDALAPGSDFDALATWSNSFECEAVAWVGHEPDVSRLAATLIGDHEAGFRFAKGAVAAISVNDEVGPGAGELHWFATAKLLGV
jgi:phosphohistidine phosphatase